MLSIDDNNSITNYVIWVEMKPVSDYILQKIKRNLNASFITDKNPINL